MMPHDMNGWAGLIAVLIAIGSTVYAWLTRSGKEAGEKVVKLEAQLRAEFCDHAAKIDRIEDRVSRIEGELRHLPDRATVHRMELSLTEMRGDMKALAERLTPVSAISERLQEFLLEQAKEVGR
jgi:hypothetical protein